MKDKTIPNETAQWSISLDVTCPKCGNYFDIIATDDEFFRYNTEPLNEVTNYEVTCPECQHDFKIDSIY